MCQYETPPNSRGVHIFTEGKEGYNTLAEQAQGLMGVCHRQADILAFPPTNLHAIISGLCPPNHRISSRD